MPPKIKKLAEYIRDYEGKPGDRNYRNNNFINARFHFGGYMPKYGKVTQDKDGFAVFPTAEQGWAYSCNMLLAACKGQSGTFKPNMTMVQFFNVFAPTEDKNDPATYCKHVCAQMGIPITTQLKDLLV